jgi:uncharacterized membrane protein HdeD (DUF308 family)
VASLEERLPELDHRQKDPKLYVMLGWVFTVLTLLVFVFPFQFLFGIAAIIMGIISIKLGAKSNGIWIIVLSSLFMVLYLVIFVFAVSFFMQNLPPIQ